MDGARVGSATAPPFPAPTARVKVSDRDELDVWVEGDGSPVVLVHGGFFWYLLKPLAEELAKERGCQAIWYHRRGYNGKPTQAVDLPEQADDVVKILDELGIEKAHVVGHSAGGPFVLALALQAPDRLSSATLLDCALPNQVPSGKVMAELAMPAIERAQAGDPAGAAADWLLAVGGTKELLDGALPGSWSAMARDAHTWFEADLPALGKWEPDPAEVKAMKVPLAWLSVSAFPPIQETGELLNNWVPTLTVLEVSTKNHFFPVTDTAETAAVIGDWVGSRSP